MVVLALENIIYTCVEGLEKHPQRILIPEYIPQFLVSRELVSLHCLIRKGHLSFRVYPWE